MTVSVVVNAGELPVAVGRRTVEEGEVGHIEGLSEETVPAYSGKTFEVGRGETLLIDEIEAEVSEQDSLVTEAD